MGSAVTENSEKKAKIAPIGTEKYRLCRKGIKYNIGEQTFFSENAG